MIYHLLRLSQQWNDPPKTPTILQKKKCILIKHTFWSIKILKWVHFECKQVSNLCTFSFGIQQRIFYILSGVKKLYSAVRAIKFISQMFLIFYLKLFICSYVDTCMCSYALFSLHSCQQRNSFRMVNGYNNASAEYTYDTLTGSK